MLYPFVFTPYPKQQAALEALMMNETCAGGLASRHIIGFGGARGGSKSHLARNAMLMRRLIFPNTQGLLFRRTVKDLRENHTQKLLSEHPWLSEFYAEVKGEFAFPNGSRIVLGYAEYTQDIYRYRGHEYDDVFVDEAAEADPEQLKFLRTVNRKSGKRSTQKQPKTLYTFNPGGPAHDYLKRLFIDRDNYQEGERPESYHFVQAYLWDNYQWVADVPAKYRKTQRAYYNMPEKERQEYALEYAGYANDLKALDEYQRKAAIFGDWNSFAGQFFGKWSPELHVIPPMEIPPWWTRLVAIDYGTQTCAIAGAIAPEGIIYITGEFYVDDSDLGPAERASMIAEWMVTLGLAEREGAGEGKVKKHVPIVADINLWYKDGSNARRMPVHDFYAEGLTNIRKVIKREREGDAYRIVCNEAVKKLLYWEKVDGELTKKPRLYIFDDTARVLIKTLPLLMVNPEKPLDFLIPKNAKYKKDHAYDALKYLVMNIAEAREPALTEKTVDTFRRVAHSRQNVPRGTSVYA